MDTIRRCHFGGLMLARDRIPLCSQPHKRARRVPPSLRPGLKIQPALVRATHQPAGKGLNIPKVICFSSQDDKAANENSVQLSSAVAVVIGATVAVHLLSAKVNACKATEGYNRCAPTSSGLASAGGSARPHGTLADLANIMECLAPYVINGTSSQPAITPHKPGDPCPGSIGSPNLDSNNELSHLVQQLVAVLLSARATAANGTAGNNKGGAAALAAAIAALEAATSLEHNNAAQDSGLFATGACKNALSGEHVEPALECTGRPGVDSKPVAGVPALEMGARSMAIAVESTASPLIPPKIPVKTGSLSNSDWQKSPAGTAEAGTECIHAQYAAKPAASNDGFSREQADVPSKALELCSAVNSVAQATSDAITATILGTAVEAIPCRQLLLLKEPADAAQRLLQLEPEARIGLLVVLCGGSSSIARGTGEIMIADVPRADKWVLKLLASVRHTLGLLEMGVLLAVLHNRFGRKVCMQAAELLLPLDNVTFQDPYINPTNHITLKSSMGSNSSTDRNSKSSKPAAALQALLLHWLLLPQLAVARLPHMSEPVLLQLLPEVVINSSTEQLQLAAQWGTTWPITMLQPAGLEPAAAAGSWCGMTGVTTAHMAHVMCSAIAVLWPEAVATPLHSPNELNVGGQNSNCLDKPSHRHRSSRSSTGNTDVPNVAPSPVAGAAVAAATALDDAVAVARAVLQGLNPKEPFVLLVMQAMLQMPAQQQLPSATAAEQRPCATAESSATAISDEERISDDECMSNAGCTEGGSGEAARRVRPAAVWDKFQLSQVLLEAYFGKYDGHGKLHLSDLIARSIFQVFSPITEPAFSAGDYWQRRQQHQELQDKVAAAAVTMLMGLPPMHLQQEIQRLVHVFEPVTKPLNPFSSAFNDMMMGLGEVADAEQALAILEVVPMPWWQSVLEPFLSPVRGMFCFTMQQLTQLLADAATAGSVFGVDNSAARTSGCVDRFEAVWGTIYPHFLHAACMGQLESIAQKQPQHPGRQQGSTEGQPEWVWGTGASYSCKPGVPFTGDGWNYEADAAAVGNANAAGNTAAGAADGGQHAGSSAAALATPPTAAAKPAPAATAATAMPYAFGSLPTFVFGVLAKCGATTAGLHVTALVQVMPVAAFSELAAQVINIATASASGNAGSVAAAVWKGTRPAYSAKIRNCLATGKELPAADATKLDKDMAWQACLLDCHKQLPQLIGVHPALQLLTAAAAASKLPLDVLPAFLTSAAEQALHSSKVCAHAADNDSNSSASQGNNVYGMGAHTKLVAGGNSSSTVLKKMAALTPKQQLEPVIDAVCMSRDAVALQHLAVMCGRVMPPWQGALVLDLMTKWLDRQTIACASKLLHARRPQLAEARSSFAGSAGIYGGVSSISSSISHDSILGSQTDGNECSGCCDGSPGDTAAATGYSSAVASAAAGKQAAAACDAATGFEGEVVWQLGQSDTALTSADSATRAASLGDAPAAADSSNAANNAATETAESEQDKLLLFDVCKLVAEVPAAPPVDSDSEDAMQEPQRIADQLKRLLSLVITWEPSCPAAAAAVATQLNALSSKRRWSADEIGALLQRLELKSAVQLVLEGFSGASCSGRRSSEYQTWRQRSRLLFALAEWHGFEPLVQAFRALLADYKQCDMAGFVDVLTDLVPASALAARSETTGYLDSGVILTAPNAYIAALLHVLELLLNGTESATLQHSESATAWSKQLAQAMCKEAVLVPSQVSRRLAETVGQSLVASSSNSLAAVPAGWQASLGQLLAALPEAAAHVAAASDGTNQAGYQLWGPLAVSVCAGMAAAAGGDKVLPCLRVALQQSLGSTTAATLAGYMPQLLEQLVQQGLLTCGVPVMPVEQDGTARYSTSNASSGSDCNSSVGTESEKAGSSCINAQVVELIQQLYQTDRVISMQQAVAALVAVAPMLGKHLPYAVAQLLSNLKARGYGTSGPDGTQAAAVVYAALTPLRPTAAAVSPAAASAAGQLSRTLALCHELLPESSMEALLSALVKVVPWGFNESAGSCISSSSSMQGFQQAPGSAMCPADAWYERQGWNGVALLPLITQAMLPACYAVWGVDKGTVVAEGLINGLVNAHAAAAASATSGSENGGGGSSSAASSNGSNVQTQSPTASSTPGSGISTDVAGGWQPDSHALRAQQAFLAAAASGSRDASNGMGVASMSHAALAEHNLLAATGTGLQLNGRTLRAQQLLLAAAACGSNCGSNGTAHASLPHAKAAEQSLLGADGTGGGTQSDGHILRAQQALLLAVASGSGSSKHPGDAASPHTQLAESRLLAAAASGSSKPVAPESAHDATSSLGVDQLHEAAGLIAQKGPCSLASLSVITQMYIILTLRRQLTKEQLASYIRHTALNSTERAAEAILALQELCNVAAAGRQVPLASYADVLAAALQTSNDLRSSSIINPEEKAGFVLDRQRHQQILLSAVVSVLGTFRGMRQLTATPAAAAVLLPLDDLAAVLCFSWELLPRATAAALAAAVAAALKQLSSSCSNGNSGGNQLVDLFSLLPDAARAGFNKGTELWLPLLQHMMVAAGVATVEQLLGKTAQGQGYDHSLQA